MTRTPDQMDKRPAPVFSGRFWQAMLVTMRPYLLFVSGSAGLVGLAYAGHQDAVRLCLTFIPLFLSYGLGQAITDCFQTDTDALSSPYRPLVRGIISARQVIGISLAGLSLSMLLLVYVNPWTAIPGVLCVIGLLAYTPFKRTWWGGPPWNAWIVAVLPFIGRMSDRQFGLTDLLRSTDPLFPAFLCATIAVFFGYINFVIIGYFKDISADSRTGYRTFPVVFGWQAAAIYSDLAAVLAVGATVGSLLAIGGVMVWAWLLLAVGITVNCHAQITIHRIQDERKAHGAIGNVVRAFIFYCLAMVAAMRPEWIVLLGLFYLCFELTLRLRPETTQV